MSIQKAPRSAWIGLAVLALLCMITVMDLTVLNLAVPHLSAQLRPSGPQLMWIIDIYGFVLACALIPIGGLGDRIGRRKSLLIGAAYDDDDARASLKSLRPADRSTARHVAEKGVRC